MTSVPRVARGFPSVRKIVTTSCGVVSRPLQTGRRRKWERKHLRKHPDCTFEVATIPWGGS